MTPAQLRAARALIDITLRDLAKDAEIGFVALNRYERGKSQMLPESMERVQAALERRGVVFIYRNDRVRGDGVCLVEVD